MVKFYQVQKEINGVNYTAQFAGLSAWFRCVDQSYIEGTNNTSTEKLHENVFKMGLVDPKVTIDDFETQEEMLEVSKFVQGVMRGEFRDQQAKVKEKA